MIHDINCTSGMPQNFQGLVWLLEILHIFLRELHVECTYQCNDR